MLQCYLLDSEQAPTTERTAWFEWEEGPPPQTDVSYYSYEYDPDPYASEADVFELGAELTTASTVKEVDKIQEVVTTVE